MSFHIYIFSSQCGRGGIEFSYSWCLKPEIIFHGCREEKDPKRSCYRALVKAFSIAMETNSKKKKKKTRYNMNNITPRNNKNLQSWMMRVSSSHSLMALPVFVSTNDAWWFGSQQSRPCHEYLEYQTRTRLTSLSGTLASLPLPRTGTADCP